ncbi:MAG: signal peptide peptidase SppA [Myxococcota bacterium]
MGRFRRFFFGLVVALLLLWWLLPGAGPLVEPGSVLVIDLSGDYVETAEPPLLARLAGERIRPFAALLSDLRKAERDERLAGVVLRIRSLDIGWAKAQEMRNAIRSLGAAGRRTIAYLELESLGANLEYFVATGAETIHMAPGTRAPLVGLAAQYFFLGGLWEKLGIEFEVEAIGQYKNAADVIAGRKMTEAHREVATALLDSIDAQFVAGIAEARGFSEAFVRDAIDQAPVSPEEMRALGLIDEVSFYDEVVDSLGDGPVIHGDRYAQVDPASLGFQPVASFALVYGSGNVVMGRGSSSPSGAPVLAADTVSAAIDAAAEDDGIDAIIFRVDSPGGSALASDMVWRAVERARSSGKPVIASFSDLAASGGYYVACGADAIVAEPSSLTGSIGVFVLRPVFAGMLEKLDIGVESQTRGAHADLLVGSRPLSEASRARLRDEIQSIYDLFVERVAAGRNLDPERVDALGQGRVWTGAQAAEIGLVDELGGLREAVNRAKQMLDIDPAADVELIPHPPPRSLREQISEALKRVVVSELPLPRSARRLEQWLALATGVPALVPPFVLDVR